MTAKGFAVKVNIPLTSRLILEIHLINVVSPAPLDPRKLIIWGADSYGIEQAKNNAKTLGDWLSSATGERVRTKPILTLPGWMVDRKAPLNAIYVLNPKEISGSVHLNQKTSQNRKSSEFVIR